MNSVSQAFEPGFSVSTNLQKNQQDVFVYLKMISFFCSSMAMNSHTFKFATAATGCHALNKVWIPILNEKLDCYHEFENDYDLFSIETCKSGSLAISYLPREFSQTPKFLLCCGTKITAEIIRPITVSIRY